MANRPTTTAVEQLAAGARRTAKLTRQLTGACPERLAELLAQTQATNQALRQIIDDPQVAPAPSPHRTSLAMTRLAAARTATN